METKKPRRKPHLGLKRRKMLHENAMLRIAKEKEIKKLREEKEKQKKVTVGVRIKGYEITPAFKFRKTVFNRGVLFLGYRIVSRLSSDKFVVLTIESCDKDPKGFYDIGDIMEYLSSCDFTPVVSNGDKMNFRFFEHVLEEHSLENLFFLLPAYVKPCKCFFLRGADCESIPIGKDLGYRKIRLSLSEATVNILVSRSEFTDNLSKKVCI